jgi:hypothetical protein
MFKVKHIRVCDVSAEIELHTDLNSAADAFYKNTVQLMNSIL